MQEWLLVSWRIAPQSIPLVQLHCPRCARAQPFVSSGRFRVNAQKKRLDAWLIYRCRVCEKTWNHPVFERRSVRGVPPELLRRLSANCPALAAEVAGELASRRGFMRDLPEQVAKSWRAGESATASGLVILFEVAAPMALRLDRLLAKELGQARARITTWEAEGRLVLEPPRRLGQSLRDGQRVSLRLAGLAPDERGALLHRACGA